MNMRFNIHNADAANVPPPADEGPAFEGTNMVWETAHYELPPDMPLDAESLLAYLSVHMKNLDSQVRGELAVMDDRRTQLEDATGALHELQTLMSEARVTHNDGDSDRSATDGFSLGDGGKRDEIVALLERAGIPTDQANRLVNGWGDYANDVDIKSAADMVNDRVGELNDANEYQMLTINDLMGKRSQLVQMVSKMMANMNETSMSVIQNMR